MLLKLLFLLLIIYYAVRATGNLIRAVRGEARPVPPRMDARDASPSNGWQRAAPRRRPPERHIEDARWEDVS